MDLKKILIGIVVVLILITFIIVIQYEISGEQGNQTNIQIQSAPTNISASPNASEEVVLIPSTTIITPTPTPQSSLGDYTVGQLDDHFVNVALGTNKGTIARYNASIAKISVTGLCTDGDIAALINFEQQFNTYSKLLTLMNSTQGKSGDIVINFMPETSIQSLASDTSYNDVYSKQTINQASNGTVYSIYRTYSGFTTTHMIFIDSDLTGDVREHYVILGVLYQLGFTGEDPAYPDSIFYSLPNTVVTLSPMDWWSVSLLYGNKISNGMTYQDIENTMPT
jgi:hypothetical protein